MLESETGSNLPYEVIAPGPKCYSILLNESSSVKQAAKGVKRSMGKLLTHDIYRGIHKQTKLGFRINVVNIRSKKMKNLTVIENRNALTKFDDKRYYLNSNTSYGYNHPDIPKVNRNNRIKKCIRICNRNRVQHILSNISKITTCFNNNQLDLNSRKRKLCDQLFLHDSSGEESE